jgi:hypothetical protein
VEEYTTAFQSLQFDISMHNCHYDELFFVTTYVQGLKEEIRDTVEPHVPVTVQHASVIARIQQRTLERSKTKFHKVQLGRPQPFKLDVVPAPTTARLQRIRQLRDYRKANNLCFACGGKYEPGHNDVCPKKQKPQVHAMALNDLDKEEITEEQLTQLAVEDAITEDFYKLSLNALFTSDSENSIKIKTQVQDKVMLILLDSRSSHNFISSIFVKLANLPTVPTKPRNVKLANGEWLNTSEQVLNLHWYIQGHTLSSDMIVLDMGPYHAILGFDWLKQNNPMHCDWNNKTLEFMHAG